MRGSVSRKRINCLPVPLSSALTGSGELPVRDSESPRSVISSGNDTSMVAGRSV